MTPTKNLELYFQHAPVNDLIALALVDTTNLVNGVIINVGNDGFFAFQNPAIDVPNGVDIIEGLNGGIWKRKSAPLLSTLPVFVEADMSIDSTLLTPKNSKTFVNISTDIVTLTVTGGATFRNPTVLNGSDTTIGLNPKESFVLTLLTDNTILVI